MEMKRSDIARAAQKRFSGKKRLFIKYFIVFTKCSRKQRIFFSFIVYTITKVQVTLFQIPQIPLLFELFFISCAAM